MDKKTVLDALDKLDANKDEQWNENGTPTIAAVRIAAGNNAITVGDIQEHAPNFKRPERPAGGGDGGNPAAGKTAAQTAPPAPREVKEREEEAAKELETSRKKSEAELKKDKNWIDGERVIALEKGHYGGAIRVVGEVFAFTGIKGSWMRKATSDEIKAFEAYMAKRNGTA